MQPVTIHTKPIPLLPVDPHWSCHRSGDCCRAVESVVMTKEEAHAVMEAAQARLTIGQLNRVEFGPHPDYNFVSLKAGPCPFLDGTNTCLVHDVRPYNCRRFGCLRVDVKHEPLRMAPHAPWLQYGSVGCTNLRLRLVQSRIARRLYATLQRKAQRWARTHGWREEPPQGEGTPCA